MRSYDQSITEAYHIDETGNIKSRPYVGVWIDVDGNPWAIPLSHKEKIINGSNIGESFFNLYGYNNASFGHLITCGMFPLAKNSYISAFNFFVEDKFESKDAHTKYWLLLESQDDIITENFESIAKNIKINFAMEEKKKIFPENKYYQKFKYYSLLKEKRDDWDNAHFCYDELKKYTTIEKPSLDELKKFRDDFNLIHNAKFSNVLKFSPILKNSKNTFDKYRDYFLQVTNNLNEQVKKKINPPKILSFIEYENILRIKETVKELEKQKKKEEEKSKNKDYERER